MVKVMSKSEVAEATGVPVKTLEHWRLRDRGEGPPSFRLGRRVVYLPEDVERWIADCRRATTVGAA